MVRDEFAGLLKGLKATSPRADGGADIEMQEVVIDYKSLDAAAKAQANSKPLKQVSSPSLPTAHKDKKTDSMQEKVSTPDAAPRSSSSA